MSQTKAELIQTVKQGTVALGDADSSHSIKLKAPATVAADRTWTMPAVDPTANQVLTADASTPTTLTWAAAAGGVDGIVSNANATAMTIDVNENIGIQTTAPQYKFEVDTTATEKTSVGFSANGESADIRFRSNNVNEAAVIRVDESGGGGLLRFHNKNGSGTLTQNLEIETDGDVKVNTGNLIIGTSGKGIDFSAHGNAGGMTSELLDDYEEGTWTPQIRCSSGTGVAGSANAGYYTKIGQMVFAHGTCQWTSVSGTTHSYVMIIGLPFPLKNSAHYRFNGGVQGGQAVGVHHGDEHWILCYGSDANNSFIYLTAVDLADESGTNYTHTPTVESTGTMYSISFNYMTDG